MTNRVSVTFDFVSTGLTLAELSALLDLEPGPSSHDKGTRSYRGLWEVTIFRIELQGMVASSLEEQLDSLFGRLGELDAANRLNAVMRNTDFYVNVASFFYTAASTLEFASRHIAMMARFNMKLDVSSYPCSEEDPSTVEGESITDTPSAG